MGDPTMKRVQHGTIARLLFCGGNADGSEQASGCRAIEPAAPPPTSVALQHQAGPLPMLSAAPEQQAANAARRRSMLQDLHARIASGDVEARDKALQALRELDNLAPAPPPGVPVPLPTRASKAAAAATALREDKMDEVAANTKVYMHGRHMEQLNQAIRLEQAARWKAMY